MAQQPVSWWDQFGPGLLSTGINYFGQQQTNKQQRQLLGELRGSQYGAEQALAGKSLALAGSMDPKQMAAERYGSQQALMAPGEEAQRQDLMRQLQKQGLLGLSSHAAVPGVVTTPGQAVNPYVAAMLAAQQTQRAKSAYQSLDEGQQYLDKLINRSTSLSAPGRAATATAAYNKMLTPKPSLSQLLLKGASGILQNPQMRDGVWDLLKKGTGLFNSSAAPYEPDYGTPYGDFGSFFE